MPDVEFVNLLGVLAVAVLAPLLLGLAPRLRVPAVTTAAALVCAGLLSVLVFPAAAAALGLNEPG